MPGYVADIIPLLQQSDLFVLSSDYEGLPGVILESLACNVPVVATESFFAAREMLGTAHSCAVVPIGNPEALANAVDQCLERCSSHSDLRPLAGPYRVEPAIASHIKVLAELVREKTAE